MYFEVAVETLILQLGSTVDYRFKSAGKINQIPTYIQQPFTVSEALLQSFKSGESILSELQKGGMAV